MAGKSPNMKVNVTADNSDLNKKMKESKTAVRDFEKVGSDAIGKLGEAFGVNTVQVEKMTSALRGLGEKMQTTGNEGTAAFGKLLTSVSGVSAAIAGIGIAGIVAGFKMLKSEAEAFKNTVQGANIELQTQAYVTTYMQFIRDYNQAIGQGAANTQSTIQKFWGSIKSITSIALKNGGDIGGAFAEWLALAPAANAVSEKAAGIANQIYQTQRQISDKTVEWARMEREIAEYKRIAYDKTVDTATQQEALEKATELINQRYQEEAELRTKLADLQTQYNDLVSSSAEDIDKANQLRVTAENVTARMNNALRELSERQATVTANAQKEAQARQEAADAAARLAQSRADLAAWNGAVSTDLTNVSGAAALSTPGIAVPVTPVLDTESVIDLTNELQQLLTSSFESIGSALGGLIGDLATGEDAWSNFSNAATSAFGDMAISIGKMAIATGTATLGIKAALESLNGYVAIAAGVALVALGTAVKSGLSNIANSGGYTSSANVATAGGYTGSSKINTGFELQELNLHITGTLRGDGNQLLGVIEQEQIRRNHTT